MGISVEGQKCPVCNAYLFDNDDVVFCPQCGAPHHRDCYLTIGKCAYEEHHGTENQYRRAEQTEIKNEPENKEHVAQQNKASIGEKTCVKCGGSFDGDRMVCPYCGTPSGDAYHTPFGPAAIIIDTMGGVGKDEKIEDIPATEVRDYVSVNTQRYLPKFKKLNKKNRISWNWAAFLFPHAWFFYRKIYFPGVFFFLMSAVFSVMASSVNLILNSAPEEIFKSYSTMYQYIADNLAIFDSRIIAISIIGLLCGVVIRIVAALSGDWLYRSAAIERISKVKNDETYAELPLSIRLRKSGGVNPALGLLGLFAIQWVANIVFAIL